MLGERLLMLDLLPREEAEPKTVVAVVDRLDGAAARVREEVEAAVGRTFGEGPRAPRLELLDRATWETLQRLAEAGIVQFVPGARRLGRRRAPPPLARPGNRQEDLRRRRLAAARELFAEGERKLRMAALLAANGFAAEAVAPLAEALEHGLLGLARLAGIEGDSALDLGPPMEVRFGSLAVDGVGLLGYLQAKQAGGPAATPLPVARGRVAGTWGGPLPRGSRNPSTAPPSAAARQRARLRRPRSGALPWPASISTTRTARGLLLDGRRISLRRPQAGSDAGGGAPEAPAGSA